MVLYDEIRRFDGSHQYVMTASTETALVALVLVQF